MSGMKQGTLPENLQAQKNNKRNIMNNNIYKDLTTWVK